AGVAEARDMHPGLGEILLNPRHAVHRLTACVRLARAGHAPVQIEHVEGRARMTQQMRDVPEAPGVLETHGGPAVADSPVAAFFAEHPVWRRTQPRPFTARSWRDISGARRMTCHQRLPEPFQPHAS